MRARAPAALLRSSTVAVTAAISEDWLRAARSRSSASRLAHTPGSATFSGKHPLTGFGCVHVPVGPVMTPQPPPRARRPRCQSEDRRACPVKLRFFSVVEDRLAQPVEKAMKSGQILSEDSVRMQARRGLRPLRVLLVDREAARRRQGVDRRLQAREGPLKRVSQIASGGLRPSLVKCSRAIRTSPSATRR